MQQAEPVLDAMWLTVESLPTIARLFPGARVLSVGRDPRDMAVGWMKGGYTHLDIMAQCYTAQMGLLDICRQIFTSANSSMLTTIS